MVTNRFNQARAGVTNQAPFGPDRVGQKEISMKSKTKWFQVGKLVARLSLNVAKPYYLAVVDGDGEYSEERADTYEAALTWAKRRVQWKTGADGKTREILIYRRWDDYEVSICVHREIFEQVTVIQSFRVL